MTKATIMTVLLGIFIAPLSSAEYMFGAEENILLGMRVAQPSASKGNDLTPPKDIPSFYRAECGSCHVLYPPNLLSDGGIFSDTSGWKEVMDDLHNHFGDNAELDKAAHQRIRRYLGEYASSNGRRFGSRTDPPRLTTTLWFRRTHGAVKSYFTNERVNSPANCSACHPRADHWRYAREEVVLPKKQHRQEHAENESVGRLE
jgi:hypothetical protein